MGLGRVEDVMGGQGGKFFVDSGGSIRLDARYVIPGSLPGLRRDFLAFCGHRRERRRERRGRPIVFARIAVRGAAVEDRTVDRNSKNVFHQNETSGTNDEQA